MESDFSRFNKLKDICEVEISQELCPAEKKKEYIRQTGSSTVTNNDSKKIRLN